MSLKTGWLVNDCLTCIPGTKTFWHDLLEWLPELEDKMNGHTEYTVLADKIERNFWQLPIVQRPTYVIRNATFFRPMNLACNQISLLQDYYEGDTQQLDVCNNSAITVFNSNYTYHHYKDKILKCPQIKIIPLGTDFELFKKTNEKHPEVLPNSVLFVGASTNNPKGFDVLMNLINTTKYNFCLVMKDSFKINHPRIKVFNRIDHATLVRIYNSCDMLVCTSVVETLHLVSIEAGACDLPIITTNIGALYNIPNGDWGVKVVNNNYIECIEYVKNNKNLFSPRQFLLNNKLDKVSCKKSWVDLIQNLVNNV